MKISDAGLAAVKRFEGLRLDAYLCPAGVPTIGYGSTKGVVMGMSISEEEAEALLREDLKWSEAAVNHQVRVPLTQGQFDALVSFTFNLGQGALASSTLLRMLNAGDYEGAAKQFDRWIYAGDQKLPGLIARRNDEQAMFEAAA